jgi:hypothetical protein
MESVMKFRKKPVVIEAHMLDETGVCMVKWLGENNVNFSRHTDGHIIIGTLEGDMRGEIGDWIIKGVKGEFYPCKPDIFEATYEPV